MKSFLLAVLAAIILVSCAPKIFQSPDATSLAYRHKTIAILPPAVTIAVRKKVDAKAIAEQQRTESVNIQKEMHSWLLKRKMQGKITPEIMDVETTVARLKKAGYPENPYSPAELCEILGVDGVISSNFGLSKPMSNGAAIAVTVIFGAFAPTNEVSVSLSIHDASSQKLIWNYDHTFSGGLGSTPSRLVDNLMRNASRKMPYLAVNSNYKYEARK